MSSIDMTKYYINIKITVAKHGNVYRGKNRLKQSLHNDYNHMQVLPRQRWAHESPEEDLPNLEPTHKHTPDIEIRGRTQV